MLEGEESCTDEDEEVEEDEDEVDNDGVEDDADDGIVALFEREVFE